MMAEVEVTNRCNLSCPYCIREVEKLEERDMTLGEFDHILNELLKIYGPSSLALSGLGEPLMNPHFINMLKNPLLKRFPVVLFSTNATLLTQKAIKSVVDAGTLDIVNVSLQSTRREVFEVLQRGASFEAVVGNTRNLIRYARGKKTRVRIQYMRTTLNPDETKADFQRLLGAEDFLFRWMSVGSASMGSSLPEKVRHLVPKPFRSPIRVAPSPKWKCKYGRNIIITAHGDLTGCCWDSSRLQTYGNVLKTPLAELRSGKLLRSLQEEQARGDFHRLPVCKRCTPA
ncbi:GTP 3',8-cyclase [subsurface metagenome]